MNELEGAVQAVRQEAGLVDEMIEMNNEREDEHESEGERWGRHYKYIQKASRKYEGIFSGRTSWTHSMSEW